MYTPNLFTHQLKATQEAASVFSAIKGVTGWERKESCGPLHSFTETSQKEG